MGRLHKSMGAEISQPERPRSIYAYVGTKALCTSECEKLATCPFAVTVLGTYVRNAAGGHANHSVLLSEKLSHYVIKVGSKLVKKLQIPFIVNYYRKVIKYELM